MAVIVAENSAALIQTVALRMTLDPAIADCLTLVLQTVVYTEMEGDELRLHHRRRGISRLRHGQPTVGQEQQQGPAVRGRPGHAARQGAARDPRQLSRY